MELSYQQILRLLERLGRSAEGFAFRGSTGYLGRGGQRGLAGPDDDPLYVVAIGAITNVASALLTEPALAEKIVVVWLGGQGLSWPDTREFNLRQDVPATRVLLDCGVPLVLVQHGHPSGTASGTVGTRAGSTSWRAIPASRTSW